MRVEVLNTGSELLLGSVVNTHVSFLGEALFPLGLRIQRQVTVPDGEIIRTALAETFDRADIVLITGGLGPTTDDITREAVAELLGLSLVDDPEVIAAITLRFEKRGWHMSPRNLRQAQRPPEAKVLVNPNGTAPGLYLAPQPMKDGAKSPHLFLLPGPPRELKPMVLEQVLPILAGLVPAQPATEMRVIRLAGIGESRVEEMVGESLLALDLELGYCARPAEVDVRTIGAPSVLDAAERLINEKLGEYIVSRDARSLEKVIVDRLTELKQTMASVESCTGGFIAHRITNVAGSSEVFMEGFVTYANEAKVRAVGVDMALIEKHGAVSAEVARAMAEGAVRTAKVDHAVSTTGIAGPGGGSEAKPVGTVFMALASAGKPTIVEKHCFPTDRENFKSLASQFALDLLRRRLEE